MASGSVGEEKVTGAKSPRPGRGEIPSDSSVQASTRASGGASSAKENGPDAAASGRRTRSVRRSDPEGHEVRKRNFISCRKTIHSSAFSPHGPV